MSEPMRVLQVVTHMNRGGLETMLMNYYRHIDRDKVQFDFLVHREAKADYDDEIQSLGGRIWHVPRLVPWSRSYRRALDAFFASHPEYVVIHVHQDCLSAVVLAAAEKRGIPVRIAHCHSASQDKNLKYLIKAYYKRKIPRYATKLFACGQAAGAWMFGGAPFEIINNAIDTAKFSYDPVVSAAKRQELGIPADVFVLGHVGRFCTVKNHTFLLDVFAALSRQEPTARLLLVGSGELSDAMKQKASSMGLADRVIFTGGRSDVHELMQAMDVFAFPSLYEGLPVTLVEAQAAGLPCFISDRVPEDCKLTPGVERIPLSAGAAVWAERILTAKGQGHAQNRETIIAAGFDIVENARKLQAYYLGAKDAPRSMQKG